MGRRPHGHGGSQRRAPGRRVGVSREPANRWRWRIRRQFLEKAAPTCDNIKKAGGGGDLMRRKQGVGEWRQQGGALRRWQGGEAEKERGAKDWNWKGIDLIQTDLSHLNG
uniref:Uncharacterized protein n=1 Tax=Oryza glumipatula TaxID=40148 RepID=A0A0E0AAM9_9ORYZ